MAANQPMYFVFVSNMEIHPDYTNYAAMMHQLPFLRLAISALVMPGHVSLRRSNLGNSLKGRCDVISYT